MSEASAGQRGRRAVAESSAGGAGSRGGRGWPLRAGLSESGSRALTAAREVWSLDDGSAPSSPAALGHLAVASQTPGGGVVLAVIDSAGGA